MGYRTITVPDTKIKVFDEKTLDKKFKPEAAFEAFFEKDSPVEHLAKTGKLGNGIVKLKRKISPGQNFPSITGFNVISYVKASTLKGQLKKCDSELEALNEFISSDGTFDGFYNCEDCRGYIKGDLAQESYNTIDGCLSGARGVYHKCTRCGAVLSDEEHEVS